MIQISAIVPTYNRPRELRLCLEGFAAQTAPRESFEVIVIDDGSEESMESLVAEFSASTNVVFRRIGNSGPSAARNLAMDTADAPLLLLYDDDLRPLPGMISYCLEFHAEHPAESHAALLWFQPDESIRNDTLVEALFPRMYPFPVGPANWGIFWSGSLTCKKSIFRFGRFSEEFRALEDIELEIRLRGCIDLQIIFERRLMGLYTRPLTLAQFLGRSYRFGYYDYHLARAHPSIWVRDQPSHPGPDIPSLIATIKSFLAKQPALVSPLFRMLQALLSQADAHARADGWKTARDGGVCSPPGSWEDPRAMA
jgi:glycosyltransferase involved in cell wall biosynthesis